MTKIEMYAPIGKNAGEMSARQFGQLLAEADGQDVTLLINSEGGEVIEGIAIGQKIQAYDGNVTAIVEGGALSIASYIAMHCDTIMMAEDAWMMIHNPMSMAQGDAKQFQSMSELMSKMETQLVKAYTTKSGLSEEQVRTMMQDETWMTAAEAVAFGFADSVLQDDGKQSIAAINLQKFHNVPAVVARASTNSHQDEEQTMAANVAEIKAACPGATAEFILQQIENEADVQTASKAWCAVVAKTNAELREENEKLAEELEEVKAAFAELQKTVEEMEQEPEPEPEAEEVEPEESEPEPEEETTKPAARGATPVPRPTNRNKQSAVARWNRLIEARIEKGETKSEATIKVARQHPALRQEMVAEINRF